jgi:hypothetical protein
MPATLKSEPIRLESNPLGEFAFFEDYVVADWNNPEIGSFDLMKMEGVAHSVYKTRPWGYISNRTHASVTNPATVYQLLQRECSPRAVAIVTYSMRSRIGAELEKQYCKSVPMELFRNLTDAQKWVQEQIDKIKHASGSHSFIKTNSRGFPAA